ncbi:MAG TPA: hypothetical protein VF423_00395 [Actinomycetes bacterium]
MPESHPRSGSRTTTALLSTATVIALLTSLIGAASPASAAVVQAARPAYARAIEPLARYQAQTTCSPTAKPGVADFAARLLRAYPTTRSLGIVRACSAGGRSEHKEGRAFDWGGLNAGNAKDRDRVKRFITWLFKADKYGNRYAMARRLGIQYLIWNRKIWGSYAASSGWRRYSGASSHRDHVHISFTWAGARKKTSFWTGKVGNIGAAPVPTLPTPAPTPTPSPTPTVVPPRPRPAPPAALPAGPPLVDETLAVPATSQSVLTTGSLSAGQPYVVEVSGTYRYGTGSSQLADAECSRSASDSTWRRDRSVHQAQPGEDHLDLFVDGVDLYADPDVPTSQACDTRTHTYRDTFTPTRSGRVTLALWDPTVLADNAGALTVRVIASTPTTRMDWQLPATAAAGVTSPGALAAGATYLVTVTGTVDAGGGVTSDAECSVASSDPVWRRDRSVVSTSPTADHLDVLLDRQDRTFEPVTDPDGDGCDATGHSYRLAITPSDTRPINLRVDDPAWTDDSGSLAVRVERVDPVVGPESLTVDSSQPDAVTTRNYLAGQALRITATGTYTAAPGITADAECSATTADPVWRSSRNELYAEGRYLGDVTLDGSPGDWVTASGARCDTTTHAYSWTVTPDETGPLSLGVADTDRTNNAGTLAITISPAAG